MLCLLPQTRLVRCLPVSRPFPVRRFVHVCLLTSYSVACVTQQPKPQGCAVFTFQSFIPAYSMPIARLVQPPEVLVLSLCDRACVKWLRCLQLLPPHTLLVVCLLVCWLGREAVSHVDLIRGAMLGHLPFLDMPVRCKDLLQTPAGLNLPVSAMKSATAYGEERRIISPKWLC